MSDDKTTANRLFRRQPEHDFLTFKDIEEQYPNTAKASTLYVWACTQRYGFNQIVTKIGGKSVVRRDRWEAFLESRAAGNQNRLPAAA